MSNQDLLVNWENVIKNQAPLFPKGYGSFYYADGTVLVVIDDLDTAKCGFLLPIEYYPHKYIEYWI